MKKTYIIPSVNELYMDSEQLIAESLTVDPTQTGDEALVKGSSWGTINKSDWDVFSKENDWQ
jgi:hypothetical protein